MLFIKNGHLKTMAGDDIQNGCLLIGDNGKITYIGENIEALADAEVIDAQGMLVTPGCVEAHCHIGLGDLSGSDCNESSSQITPEMRAIDGINPQNNVFKNAIKGGITSVCTGPGSANIIGGTFAAIKCYGNRVDDMIIKNPVAMKCAFGENPKKVHGQGAKAPKTRMATAALLREFLYKAKKYYDDKQSGLPYDEAWKAITINPATLIGIGDRVGSLEVGKDGDVVICQADPLREISADPLITVIDGKVVYRAE